MKKDESLVFEYALYHTGIHTLKKQMAPICAEPMPSFLDYFAVTYAVMTICVNRRDR